MKVTTSEEMKALDWRATREYLIPSLMLMEQAGWGIADRIAARYGAVKGKKIRVVAGRGNNGGDGLAAARHLREKGAHVAVYLLNPIEKIEGEASVNLDIWMKSDGVLHPLGTVSWEEMGKDFQTSDLIIDALLGTGLSRTPQGDYVQAISLINRSKCRVVSVDLPSGISADTGERLGIAVKADYTLTLGLPKRGLFVNDGVEYRGDWDRIDVGFPQKLIDQAAITTHLVCGLPDFPPLRPVNVHKGVFGHLMVIAGSVGKKGAAKMTSLAALRCGAGLVTSAIPKSLDPAFGVVEGMTLPLPETDEGTLALPAASMILDALRGKSAIALGPGLSQHPETVALIRHLIVEIGLPMVIDADGLNAIAADPTLLAAKKGPLVLTPHPGEMGRLLGVKSDVIQKDRFTVAADFAKKWDLVLVLKGAHTLIAAPDGAISINNSGNSGMATAGTGDVLTGMIGGWLAQGIDPLTAARWGVYLHGLAGDLAAKKTGEISLMASDLIGHIPEAIKIERAK